MNLVLRFGHVVEQNFQNHGTTEASSFNFEIRKAHGEISVLNLFNADKARIGHGFGEPIALIATGGGAMVIYAVFSQILSADILIAAFSLGAAEPAAFVAEKLHLVFLGIFQGIQFVKGFIQPKIRDNISEILPVHLVKELPEVCQHLCCGGYKIEVSQSGGLKFTALLFEHALLFVPERIPESRRNTMHQLIYNGFLFEFSGLIGLILA